jgi:4-methylaminobutanoate oxidase (formaldehyde-forming)
MSLPGKAPVVIIGGGIIGCSTLYHLAHKGVSAVLMIPKA